MFVPVVLIVLVLFYIYISIYLVSTRFLAYCSFVLSLPPENDEGENWSGKKDRTNFFSILFLRAFFAESPRSLLKHGTMEQLEQNYGQSSTTRTNTRPTKKAPNRFRNKAKNNRIIRNIR